MKALVVEKFGSPDDLVLREFERPEPGSGEVLVDVAAIGVNFPDLLVIGGRYQFLPERPFSPGKEFAGTVISVGAGVERLAAGDRVLAQVEYGAYQETVALPERRCSVLPADMSFEEAAAFPLNALTADFAIRHRARLQAGETVLVTGASGAVGLAAVQIAKTIGARVIALASTPEKREIALQHGADVALDPDPLTLPERIREATDGCGSNVVLENVGGELFTASLRSLAWEGRLVVIGFAGGEIPTVRANYVLVKNISVSGLQVSDYRDRYPDLWLEAQEHLLSLWRVGLLRVPIRDVYPLEHAADALHSTTQRQGSGRVVLTTGPRSKAVT
jgi:NADPH:quinone reductase-like Zn-dependent oxidoreductase